MSLRRISRKREGAIKSGTIRTAGNSTFLKMTAQEFREGRTLKAKEVHRGLARRSPVNARSEKQKAKQRAWKWFSLFIRIRDADQNGLVRCCTCGRLHPWRKVDAGHYKTRAKESTLFHEQNVHGQCKGCNKWQGGRPTEYERFITERYGAAVLENIRYLSITKSRPRRIDHYQAIEEQYREKVRVLLLEKPWISL